MAKSQAPSTASSQKLTKTEAMANMVRYSSDFKAFVVEVLGATPFEYQEEILRAVCDPTIKRIAWHKGHGVGGTTLMSWCIIAFLFTRPQSKVVTTASVYRQVKDILWPEIHRWMRKAELWKMGWKWNYTLLDTELRISKEWFAQGHSSDTPENMEGFHAPNIMYIVDEAKTVEKGIFESIEGALTNAVGDAKLLVVSTPPMSKSGHFYEICSGKVAGFKVFHTKCQDSPNIDPGWIADRKIEWGENSPQYISRVLGEFPDATEDTLIPVSWVEEANRRWEIGENKAEGATCAGVDVARYGCFDDKTEILTSDGWKYFQDLVGHESVLTLYGDVAKWGIINDVHKYWFDGKMNLHDGKRINFCITDNHRLHIIRPKSDKYVTEEYHKLPINFSVRRTNVWEGVNDDLIEFTAETSLPNGGFRRKTWKFSMEDWAELVGWFVSEGSTYIDKIGRHYCQIAQDSIANPDKKKRIGDLLLRMGIKSSYRGKQWSFCIKPIVVHLREHCGVGSHNKRVPKYIKESTTNVMDRFLESYSLGDGSARKCGGKTITTSSKLLADDIQEMLIKNGYHSKVSTKNTLGSIMVIEGRTMTRKSNMYDVNYVKFKHDSDVSKKNVEKIDYSGFVYCVSVDSGIIMVRRKGCPMWSGNSDSSVIAIRRGYYFDPLVSREKRDTMETAGLVAKLVIGSSIPEIKVDLIGVGAGVHDRLRELAKEPNSGFRVRGINVTNRAPFMTYKNEKLKFHRLRDWLYWNVRIHLDPNNPNPEELLALPKDEKLMSQLTSIRYKILSDGSIQIEDKDSLKKRGYSSPDRAEAVMIAMAGGYEGWATTIVK